MSDPSTPDASRRFQTGRLIRLIILGIVLTPVAAIMGAAAVPGTFAIWIFALLTFLVTFSWSLSGGMVAFPLIYGALWGAPITCVVLPLIGAFMPRATPLRFVLFAAAAGIASAALLIASRLYPIDADGAPSILFAGAIAGAITGAIFGLVVRRRDQAS